MKLAFFMDIEVWIGSLAIKPAFIIADEVRQGGRTDLQARQPTHNYPRGDPGRGNSGRGNPGRGDPGRGDPGVPIPAGAEKHILRIILACLQARWYICDRITSGQGENPDRR